MTGRLTHAVITPAHNEAENLARLADCMSGQTHPPEEWVIVDNGSSDGTAEQAASIASRIPWARSIYVPKADRAIRGAPVVASFHAGLGALVTDAEIVTKLDADVSFEHDFFARLTRAFEDDENLGMTGGVGYELGRDGRWHPDHVTRGHIRGATRAYRRACLEDVLPLEERMGWDGIDELRARVAGWETRSQPGLAFRHHRPLGAREDRWGKWVGQGDMAHFMGYRFGYLGLRTAYRALQEPTAVGMVWGFLRASFERRPQFDDARVRSYLRSQQSARSLPQRAREALGRSQRS